MSMSVRAVLLAVALAAGSTGAAARLDEAAMPPIPAGPLQAPWSVGFDERAAPARAGKGDRREVAQNIFKRVFGGGSAGGGAAGDDAKKRALLAAYPGAFTIEDNVVVFPSGERIVWDDGRAKSAAELLTDADVEDMFTYAYPLAREGERAPGRNEDPGRVRNEAFFRALYGGTKSDVARTTTTIAWVPALGDTRMTVTTRFGVADRLRAVSEELQRLPQRFHKYLTPPAGGFVWRPIAGTDRLSVHSFGAAVDINTKFTNYWRWDGQPEGGTIPYKNQIPIEIVEVFEKHCFIWGGRWYHYDTMHFEYRPELVPACQR